MTSPKLTWIKVFLYLGQITEDAMAILTNPGNRFDHFDLMFMIYNIWLNEKVTKWKKIINNKLYNKVYYNTENIILKISVFIWTPININIWYVY